MRAGALLAITCVLALAGCMSGSAPTTTQEPSAPSAPLTTINATTNLTDLPLVGDRGEMVSERFFLGNDHKLHFMANASDAGSATSVAESFSGTGFFTGAATPTTFPPWEGPPSQRAFEVMQDIPITIRFTSAQPAVSATKGVQFPPVGGWFGTKDRWAVYFSAADAPDALEAGKTYTLTMTAKMPTVGYFHRVGESLALHTYLAYQAADGSPVSYVVGGPEPAGFPMPHAHFNVSAPVETKVYDKSGTLGPNPGPSTTSDPQPALVSIDVPAGSAYLVAVLTAAPTAPGGGDADLTLLAGSDVLGAGGGPTGSETVVLGPTALAKANGKLTARVAGAMAGGGTFKLVVTAYGQ